MYTQLNSETSKVNRKMKGTIVIHLAVCFFFFFFLYLSGFIRRGRKLNQAYHVRAKRTFTKVARQDMVRGI